MSDEHPYAEPPAPPVTPALPAVLHGERVRLPLWDAATAAALRSGGRRTEWHREFPRPEDVDAAVLWRDGDTWGMRSVVSLRSGLVMGTIGFYAPPATADGAGGEVEGGAVEGGAVEGGADAAEVEIGFGLVPFARGHGAMTEALALLLPAVDATGVQVRAALRPENRAAMRLLTGAGFTRMRGADEDGRLVVVRPRRAWENRAP